MKKIWARDIIAGLALIAFVGQLILIGLHIFDAYWSAREEMLILGWLFINLVAIALLFTDRAVQWFGDLSK